MAVVGTAVVSLAVVGTAVVGMAVVGLRHERGLCRMGFEVGEEQRAVGELQVDQSRLYNLSVASNGWVSQRR